MADDAQFDPLAGILTPQTLAAQRAQQAAAFNQHSQGLGGIDFALRQGGYGIGQALGNAFGGGSAMDQQAAQNQQLLTQPSGVQETGDSYVDQAAKYDELAKRFLAAGNPQQASKFVQAAQIMRQEGQRNQAEQASTQLNQAKLTDYKTNAGSVVVDMTPDKYGIPAYKKVGDTIPLFNDDGTVNKQFSDARTKALADAKSQGVGAPQVMSIADYNASKERVAALKATQAIDTANIRAQTAAATTAAQAGSLDPDDIHTAALVTLSDPARMHDYVSWGKAGQAKKDAITHEQNQIMKSAGIDPSQLQSLRAQAKGDATAITKLGPQLSQIKANEELAHNNGDRLIELVDNVNPTKYKSINGLLQAVAKGTGGDDAAEFASVLTTFQSEAARIVNGSPTGSGVLSDSSRHELQQVVDGTLAPSSLKRVINRLFLEFNIRQGAIANSAKSAGIDASSLFTGPKSPQGGGLYSGPSTIQNAAPGAANAATGAPPQATAGAPQEGAMSVSKSGKPIVFSNGHWQYK